MVYFFNSLVTVALAVAGLVQSVPIVDSDLIHSNAGIFQRDVAEMAAGLADREVVKCKITSPTSKTKWTAGKKVSVTWDPSCVKKEKFSNYTGTVLLGYKTANSNSYHLRPNHPLDDDFLLRKGKTSFTLPSNITTRSTYFVVLMGDSSNKSPEFTIHSSTVD